ncbi:MAG TPA: histidine kinase N-terminal 7TM domain-containing protein [Spirochaetota bacterium]|nr:histidine kinase N-terminal 7TM domain-containing protein [Spirochaetota bacterium]
MTGHQLFLIFAPVSALILFAVMLTLVKYRHEPSTRAIFWYLGSVSALLLFNTAELITPSHQLTVFFAKMEYIAYESLTVSWFFFCLIFTGQYKKIPLQVVVFILAIPLGILLLVFTNEYHYLFWSTIQFAEVDGLVTLHPGYGPVFWVNSVYTYLLLGGGGVFVLRAFTASPQIYRRQAVWIFLGLVLPFVFNVIYVFRLIPGFSKDFTPISFALSGFLFFLGQYFGRLFWVVPVARGVIFEIIDTGVIVLDSNFRILDLNHKAEEYLHFDYDPVGRAVEDVPELEFVLRLPENKLQSSFEFLHSAENRILNVRIQEHVQGHTSSGWILILDDFTEKIRLQNELDIIHGQIIHQDKLAAIGQLTAGLAHEINNPLSYLQSDLRSLETLIKDKNVGPEQYHKDIYDIFEGAQEAIQRISTIVTDLLNFARKGDRGADFEIFDLNKNIISTLELAKYEYKNLARIDLRLGDIPLLRARKNEINQVILNILTNACHALAKKNADVTETNSLQEVIKIRTWGEDRAVLCEIENSGPPIPPDIQEQIFMPFFTRRENKEGTGLGLGISKDIIEKNHNGSLSLASADPVVFRIVLPVHDD